MLHSNINIPSPSTISRDVQEMFSLSQTHIAVFLQSHIGKLHLAVDGWTSPNVLVGS
ncbi:hypothetical protein JAAARDRAFT_197497 [Jaapia argillacea MUCL 33604]|uniref:Uncharacterized protein n=1 Tax=Jaapia argillacea MUCL 33604 TaxID=933084 RepID=A0A067PPV8_9AGAM|nr:hypothetical protein JAAARDRAFT_197497 [Jaapia argillacea MUCL 33604]